MDKITFQMEGGEAVEFFVLEQTTLGGCNYLLVTEEEDGDGEAYILKDLSRTEDVESIYEMVSDEDEMAAVADVFENLLDDVDFITEDEEE